MTPRTPRICRVGAPRPALRAARLDLRGLAGRDGDGRPHVRGRAERREAAPDREVGSRRVLVVDDEHAIRLLCRVNLPLAGFEVVEAASGEDALARARGDAFDLVLLDVMMPGLNGFAVAERLRADPVTAATPIVFLSARADAEDVRRGLALGAADYVTKPFDPLALGAHLTNVLRAVARGAGGDAV